MKEARLIYRGSKALQSSDYHTEMNSDVFQKWMIDVVFPNLPKNSVVVLDRATYHLTLTEDTKPANSASNKQQLAEWLFQHKIEANKYKSVQDCMVLKKLQLTDLCKQNKPKPEYEIDELGK